MLTLLLLALTADPVPERTALLDRATKIRLTRAALRWQDIPWLTDADAALATATRENRPLAVWVAGGRGRDGSPLERC